MAGEPGTWSQDGTYIEPSSRFEPDDDGYRGGGQPMMYDNFQDHSGGNNYNQRGGNQGYNNRNQGGGNYDRGRYDNRNRGGSGGYRGGGGGGGNRGGNRGPVEWPTEPPYELYCGHLPENITEKGIDEIFCEYTIKNVRMIRENDTNRFKGYAYIELGSLNELKKACDDLNEAELMGNVLVVNPSHGRNKNRGGRGGRGGGGDRGRGNFQNRGGGGGGGDRYGNDNYRGGGRGGGGGRNDYNQRGGGGDRRGGRNDDYQSRRPPQEDFPTPSASDLEGRPRLKLAPRSKPVDDDLSRKTENMSIFGAGKPRDEKLYEKKAYEKSTQQR